MIFSSIANAFRTMVFRPAIFLPVLAAVLFGKVLAQLASWAWFPFAEMLVYWQGSAENPLLAVIMGSPFEMGVMLVVGIIIFSVSVISLIFLGYAAKGESVKDAVNEAVLGWKRAFSVSIVLLLILLIFWLVMQAFISLTPFNYLLAFALMLGLFVLGLFVAVKLLFIFPVAAEEKNVKHIFHESWRFISTYKGFAKAVLFIVLAGIIMFIIHNIFLFILTGLYSSGITEELLTENIIPVVEETITTTFFGLAIASYYFKK